MMESAISPVERASRAVAIEQLLNEEGRLSDACLHRDLLCLHLARGKALEGQISDR